MAPPDGGSLGQREQRLIDRAFEAFGWRTGAGGGLRRLLDEASCPGW